jgi:predicted CXXCH cytochrome family protein
VEYRFEFCGWRRAPLVGAVSRCALLVAICFALLSTLTGCGNSDDPSEPPPPGDKAGASQDHYLGSAHATPVAFPIVPAAPRPTGPLPEGTACMTPECHASYTRASRIHAPVSKGACDTCHHKDVGGHKYPILRGAIEMCTFCHAMPKDKTHKHKPLKKGCTSCHKPHAGNAKFLLKGGSVEQSCARCHRVPWKRYTHTILTKANCTVCHEAHQADNKFLLRSGSEPKHCYLCHDDLRKEIKTAAHVHKPVGEKCSACHEPHASDYPNQLKMPMDQMCYSCHKKTKLRIEKVAVIHGAILKKDKCANCHSPHTSQRPKLLGDRMDKVCLKCHNQPVTADGGRVIPNMAPVLTKSKFLHGPVRSGNCSGCHDPHGTDEKALLKRPFAQSFYASFDVKNFALCFKCHTDKMVLAPKTTNLTNFRNGSDNLHYKHVNRTRKGRTCRTCHVIHGSDRPKHMAENVPFEGSDWPMPIRHDITPTGGTCAPGCHKSRAYDREHPTTRPAPKGTK